MKTPTISLNNIASTARHIINKQATHGPLAIQHSRATDPVNLTLSDGAKLFMWISSTAVTLIASHTSNTPASDKYSP